MISLAVVKPRKPPAARTEKRDGDFFSQEEGACLDLKPDSFGS